MGEWNPCFGFFHSENTEVEIGEVTVTDDGHRMKPGSYFCEFVTFPIKKINDGSQRGTRSVDHWFIVVWRCVSFFNMA